MGKGLLVVTLALALLAGCAKNVPLEERLQPWRTALVAAQLTANSADIFFTHACRQGTIHHHTCRVYTQVVQPALDAALLTARSALQAYEANATADAQTHVLAALAEVEKAALVASDLLAKARVREVP